MHEPQPDTDQLLADASAGDEVAAHELLARCRPRLKRMVAVRLDPRLSARVDPSDVVQEALAEAHQKLSAYLQTRPVSFYPWLRSIAWERLVKTHRWHIGAARRSVHREGQAALLLSDASAAELADRLASPDTGPSDRVFRSELRRRAVEALEELADADRELLAMRYLEQMPMKEIAETLSISPAAARMRHLRALEKLEALLNDSSNDS